MNFYTDFLMFEIFINYITYNSSILIRIIQNCYTNHFFSPWFRRFKKTIKCLNGVSVYLKPFTVQNTYIVIYILSNMLLGIIF